MEVISKIGPTFIKLIHNSNVTYTPFRSSVDMTIGKIFNVMQFGIYDYITPEKMGYIGQHLGISPIWIIAISKVLVPISKQISFFYISVYYWVT